MGDLFSQYIPIGAMFISILAFIVSVITQVIKDLTIFKPIPTNLVVVVLSLVVTVLAYTICCSISGYRIYWYGIIGSLFAGFIVAYIATYGWEKFNALWQRYQNYKDTIQRKDKNQ
jgi:high-affinity Fe2+/Pb2+ permease